MAISGYSKLPGKASRYRTPEGTTISRRQYENLRFRKAGWRNWSDYQRTAKTRDYRRWVEAAAKEHNVSARKFKNPDSHFNQLYLDARNADWDHTADGSFADLLTYLGLRQPDASYDVGDTP